MIPVLDVSKAAKFLSTIAFFALFVFAYVVNPALVTHAFQTAFDAALAVVTVVARLMTHYIHA